MKLVKFCAVGAFLCCGGLYCYAQDASATLESPFQYSEPSSNLVPTPTAEIDRSSDSADAEIEIDGGENPHYISSPSDATVKAAESTDPASLPVDARQLSPIDQILQQGLVSQYSGDANQIVWPVHQRPDNPTARVMKYGWCGDGLWCNFPAERAAQCAAIQRRLAGHQHCGHCSICNSCASGSCNGHTHAPVRNRYLTGAAGGCDSLAAPCPSCQASNLYGPLNISSRLVPVEVVTLPAEKTKVAAVPTVVR
jgi:hypothetical protein